VKPCAMCTCTRLEISGPTLIDDLPRRAVVVGVGLIGASIGIALRQRGWHVSGRDVIEERAKKAVEIGALDAVGDDPEAQVVFIATPVGSVVEEARRELNSYPGFDRVVTDVAGVKAAIVSAVNHPSFVGGHPMAGSEQVGLDGAYGDMFVGATWVLTPTKQTNPHAYARLQSVISSLGADVVAVPPARHDALVAIVSHVPHLTASVLMDLASESAADEPVLLRLAAGGFRDMTRVAAGHPGIWPEICQENSEAIVFMLDRLEDSLRKLRESISAGDREYLSQLLGRASKARRNLPSKVPPPDRLVEMRVPVPDRLGVLAEVTTTAGDLGVNIFDLEIAHSQEGAKGVLVLVVDGDASALLERALVEKGYRVATNPLETKEEAPLLMDDGLPSDPRVLGEGGERG